MPSAPEAILPYPRTRKVPNTRRQTLKGINHSTAPSRTALILMSGDGMVCKRYAFLALLTYLAFFLSVTYCVSLQATLADSLFIDIDHGEPKCIEATQLAER
jgi:hypothetical protein